MILSCYETVSVVLFYTNFFNAPIDANEAEYDFKKYGSNLGIPALANPHLKSFLARFAKSDKIWDIGVEASALKITKLARNKKSFDFISFNYKFSQNLTNLIKI